MELERLLSLLRRVFARGTERQLVVRCGPDDVVKAVDRVKKLRQEGLHSLLLAEQGVPTPTLVAVAREVPVVIALGDVNLAEKLLAAVQLPLERGLYEVKASSMEKGECEEVVEQLLSEGWPAILVIGLKCAAQERVVVVEQALTDVRGILALRKVV
ncbi:MAG: hypothetical protein QXU69_07130 [Thermofilaceae archaeon]